MQEAVGYEDLANAIVVQAAKEYEGAYINFLDNPESYSARVRLSELMVFFNSPWYRMLTTVESEYLINSIESAVKKKRAMKIRHGYAKRKDY